MSASRKAAASQAIDSGSRASAGRVSGRRRPVQTKTASEMTQRPAKIRCQLPTSEEQRRRSIGAMHRHDDEHHHHEGHHLRHPAAAVDVADHRDGDDARRGVGEALQAARATSSASKLPATKQANEATA